MKKLKDVTDVHTEMIESFIEYSFYNNRYKIHGYKESFLKARIALSKIANLAKMRRNEISADERRLYKGNEDELTEQEKKIKKRLKARKNQKYKGNDDGDNT
jgi:hypothetical protein